MRGIEGGNGSKGTSISKELGTSIMEESREDCCGKRNPSKCELAIEGDAEDEIRLTIA
jgi:hypothetical protein